MKDLSDRQMNVFIVTGAITAILGLVLFLVFRGPYERTEFWSIYRVATSGAGLMMLIFGIAWLLLGLAHRHSNFFDLSAKLEADKFAISLIAIGIVVVVALVIVLPKLPRTEPGKIRGNAEQKAKVLRVERNFRMLVTIVVLASGAAVASVPFRRFLR